MGRYGEKLSDEELDRQLVKLHTDIPWHIYEKYFDEIERSEFELIIDNRLGKDFPADRREELWKAKKKILRKTVINSIIYTITDLITFGRATKGLVLHSYVIEKVYGKILDREDLISFFGEEFVESNNLPEAGRLIN